MGVIGFYINYIPMYVRVAFPDLKPSFIPLSQAEFISVVLWLSAGYVTFTALYFLRRFRRLVDNTKVDAALSLGAVAFTALALSQWDLFCRAATPSRSRIATSTAA